MSPAATPWQAAKGPRHRQVLHRPAHLAPRRSRPAAPRSWASTPWPYMRRCCAAPARAGRARSTHTGRGTRRGRSSTSSRASSRNEMPGITVLDRSCQSKSQFPSAKRISLHGGPSMLPRDSFEGSAKAAPGGPFSPVRPYTVQPGPCTRDPESIIDLQRFLSFSSAPLELGSLSTTPRPGRVGPE